MIAGQTCALLAVASLACSPSNNSFSLHCARQLEQLRAGSVRRDSGFRPSLPGAVGFQKL